MKFVFEKDQQNWLTLTQFNLETKREDSITKIRNERGDIRDDGREIKKRF